MTLRAAEQDWPEIAHERARFHKQIKSLDASKLVFIDESGAATNMVRLYGRATIGERACGTQPARRYEQITLFGALSLKGFLAPMTIEGAANTDVVAAYMERVLLPRLEPGQIIVLDNLSSHKAERIERLVEAAGCKLLFLPPYSPDLRPNRRGVE